MIRAIQITSLPDVPEAELLRRLEALAAAPAARRAEVAVMLRDPGLSPRALLRLGERLRAVTAGLGVALLVNDRLDVARLVGADGIHLGRRSVSLEDARAAAPGLSISTSAHAAGEARAAFARGADRVLLSPIFASPGKGPPLGLAALGEAPPPPGRALLALGGVGEGDVERCLAAGASGVAAIRADVAGAWALGRR